MTKENRIKTGKIIKDILDGKVIQRGKTVEFTNGINASDPRIKEYEDTIKVEPKEEPKKKRR